MGLPQWSGLTLEAWLQRLAGEEAYSIAPLRQISPRQQIQSAVPQRKRRPKFSNCKNA
jgi:hypothetical protein